MDYCKLEGSLSEKMNKIGFCAVWVLTSIRLSIYFLPFYCIAYLYYWQRSLLERRQKEKKFTVNKISNVWVPGSKKEPELMKCLWAGYWIIRLPTQCIMLWKQTKADSSPSNPNISLYFLLFPIQSCHGWTGVSPAPVSSASSSSSSLESLTTASTWTSLSPCDTTEDN